MNKKWFLFVKDGFCPSSALTFFAVADWLQVQKTCENFLKLVAKGYYKDTVFHRSIKNFMVSLPTLPSLPPSPRL